MKINRSAVKRYALRCSELLRAEKFTRVGEGFLQSVEVDVETHIRQLSGAPPERMPMLDNGETFTNWAEIEPALKERMELLVRSLIVRKVLRHPSLGCTLQQP
jgi:hypothetical protein